MKRLLLPLMLGCLIPVSAETVTLGGTDYEYNVMTRREIGPGIVHTRYRLPSYPLNINVLTVDLNNPYNSIETTVANETAKGTETLVHAANRQSRPGHRAVGGANANFWVVATQPEENTYTGTTRNASVRNGMIVTESNQHRDQWDGGTMRSGVVALSSDKTMYVDYCKSTIGISGTNLPRHEVHQVNKGIHTDELCMYNSFYGATREFMPIYVDGNGKYQHDAAGDATEVILDLVEGASFASNTPVQLEVKEVRLNGGKGKLGNHDLALVGRGDNAAALAAVQVGDILTLEYSWTYNPGSADEVTPQVMQAVGPNALVMRQGELTAHNTNENYNSQVYSRTGYGCSADGKTLYIIVIDKSTDPVYGSSAGCNTAKMCEFARMLGCSYMANFDAGGSAQMFVNGKVENRTTEGNPRAVANGWLIYNIAPEDVEDANTVARLEFDAITLEAPIYANFSPTVIAYNRYGAVLDYDFRDFTLTASEGIGTGEGNVFYAAGTPGVGTITASFGNVSVTKEVTVKQAQMSLRIKNLLIDGNRTYPVEVVSNIDDTEYTYDPSTLSWTVEDPTIVEIDEAGVMRGLKEGTTTYSCSIGTFSDQATVTVQIAPEQRMMQESWEGWTKKSSTGLSQDEFTAEGLYTFNYASPRDPYITLTKETVYYSLPDAIVLELRSSVPLRNVTADLRAPFHTRANNVVAAPESGSYPKNTDLVIEFPFSSMSFDGDMAIYPLTLKSLRFNIEASTENQGQQSIQLGNFYASYNNFSGVESVTVDSERPVITPNPVNAGSKINVTCSGIERIDLFTPAGAAVSTSLCSGDNTATFNAPSVPGAYVVRMTGSNVTYSSIIIVK